MKGWRKHFGNLFRKGTLTFLIKRFTNQIRTFRLSSTFCLARFNSCHKCQLVTAVTYYNIAIISPTYTQELIMSSRSRHTAAGNYRKLWRDACMLEYNPHITESSRGNAWEFTQTSSARHCITKYQSISASPCKAGALRFCIIVAGRSNDRMKKLRARKKKEKR